MGWMWGCHVHVRFKEAFMTDAHAALMSQGVAHLEGGLVFRQRRGVGLWGIIPPSRILLTLRECASVGSMNTCGVIGVETGTQR